MNVTAIERASDARGRRATPDGGPGAPERLTSVGFAGYPAADAREDAQACTRWHCPACRLPLTIRPNGYKCARCGQRYPVLSEIPDLRVRGDAYLSLRDERAKALRLAQSACTQNLEGLAARYYAITEDVDACRRARYLAHIRRAGARGEYLASLLPAGRVLELGTGTGGLVAAAAGLGRDIVGTDIALRWLVLAQRRLADLGLEGTLVAADAAALPWADQTFDVAVADSLVEHLEDPAAAFREWARVVRPGGHLMLWSPNRLSLLPDPHVGLWGVGFMPRRWAESYVRMRRGCGWRVRPRSAADVARLARANGWRDVRLTAPQAPSCLEESGNVQAAIRVYNGVARHSLGRRVLTRLGPLWQLTAVRGDAL